MDVARVIHRSSGFALMDERRELLDGAGEVGDLELRVEVRREPGIGVPEQLLRVLEPHAGLGEPRCEAGAQGIFFMVNKSKQT